MNNCGNCTYRQIGICINIESDRLGKATPAEYSCDNWAETLGHTCIDCKWSKNRPGCMVCTNNKSDNVGYFVNALTGCKEWEKQ